MDYPEPTKALKALAKETGKPYTLLKTNYETGDQLIVGRVNDILGIKATRRETKKEVPVKPITPNPTNATCCVIPAPTLEPITPVSTNATSRKKRKAGRPQLGEKPLTSTERVRLSRERRRYPKDGSEYSGKMLSTMINGEAHSALDDLLNKYSDLSQKEIIEQAIIHYNRHNQGETTC